MLEAIVVAQQKTEGMLEGIIECMDGLHLRLGSIGTTYQQMTAQLNSVTKDCAPHMQWAAVQSLRLTSKATDKLFMTQMTAQLNSVTKDCASHMQWVAVQSLRLASKATDKIAHDLYVALRMICLFVTTMQHSLIKSCQ